MNNSIVRMPPITIRVVPASPSPTPHCHRTSQLLAFHHQVTSSSARLVTYISLIQIKAEWNDLGEAGQAEWEDHVSQEADNASSERARRVLRADERAALPSSAAATAEASLALVADIDAPQAGVGAESHQLALDEQYEVRVTSASIQ